MKKILFVISYLDKGGAERALSNITTHFPEGWHIDILVNDDKVIDYPYRANILTLGITEPPQTASVWFQFKVLLKRIKKLKQLKKEGHYRACISFLDSANIANILSGRSHCKVIISVRNSLVQQERMPQYRYIVEPLVKTFYNKADKVIAVSKGIELELLKVFKLEPKKVTTIENGYDILEIWRQAQEKLTDKEQNILTGKKVIVTTGRLSPQKGQWHLIRAFREVIKQVPDAFLFIMGSGELEGYLRSLVKMSGFERNVYFAGYTSNPYKYMKNADIFVLPSLYEGFPNALAEAVCLGLPCIATDFRTGAREILAPDIVKSDQDIKSITDEKYGIITPLCTGKRYKDFSEPLEPAEQCLAQAMIDLLSDKEKNNAYRQKSKNRSETLEIDAVVKRWIKAIELL